MFAFILPFAQYQNSKINQFIFISVSQFIFFSNSIFCLDNFLFARVYIRIRQITSIYTISLKTGKKIYHTRSCSNKIYKQPPSKHTLIRFIYFHFHTTIIILLLQLFFHPSIHSFIYLEKSKFSIIEKPLKYFFQFFFLIIFLPKRN